jgi:trk system potassium uptake protein
MFVLIVGCGRVGSAIAKRMIKAGHDVSVLDESEEAHALLDHDLDQTWEDSGGRFTVGTALEVEALDAAGIQNADVVVCSTDGDNTNIVVAQIAKKRFQVPKVVVRVLDPYRADWYSQQGIHTVCPTQVAIEMLTEAVAGEDGNTPSVVEA